MFRNDEQKILGVLLTDKSLGSIRNEMHRGMQYGGFSCLPNLIDFSHIYIFFQNTICRNVVYLNTICRNVVYLIFVAGGQEEGDAVVLHVVVLIVK